MIMILTKLADKMLYLSYTAIGSENGACSVDLDFWTVAKYIYVT